MKDNVTPSPESTFATVQRIDSIAATNSGEDLGSIGPYQLMRELGRGGMGAVYLAKHVNLQRTVAVKVLPREFSDSPERLARFRREMAAIGRLEHPNIVLATDAGDVDGVAYIAMQYIEGIDVGGVCKQKGPLGIADAAEIVRQAALGLQHIADCGLVHRDIKPSNLFLTKNGEVKILDLGLAMLREHDGKPTAMTSPNAIMGTPDYIAPEQINHCHQVDIRADIYSLGCTFYSLLSGKAPFEGKEYSTATSKLMAHAEKQAVSLSTFRPDLPKEVLQTVERMMAKSPEQRFLSPKDVANALTDWSAGSSLATLADPRHSVPFTREKVARSKWPQWAMGAGVGTALLIAVLVPWSRSNRESSSTAQLQQNKNGEMPSDSHSAPPTATQALGASSETPPSQSTVPAAVNPSESLTEIASSIDRSTQRLADSANAIQTSNEKVADNTRQIAVSFEELLKRLDNPQGNTLLADPKTPGEHYYNALAYGIQGNARMVRQSFLKYFELNQDFIDPHLKFIESLKLQEGIASARETYKNLPGDRTLVSRRFAESSLLETAERKAALQSMTASDESFAPAWFALSNLYSPPTGTAQTFLELKQEKELLQRFMKAQEQGGLVKYYLDQSQATSLIARAESRLKTLETVDQQRIDHPITLTVSMKIADNWQILFEIAEPAKDILYRIGEVGEFQSTGKLAGIDPATGNPLPKKSIMISDKIQKETLYFRYIDLKDQTRGDFPIVFDSQEQTKKWEIYAIQQTQSAWLRLTQDRLFFDIFQSGRSVLKEVRYGIDTDTPNKIKPIPAAPLGTENGHEYYEAVSLNVQNAVIQLTFADGTQSEIVRVNRR
jgi:serine/threonine protein kinase